MAAAASTAVVLLALAGCGSGHGSGSAAKASGAKPKAVAPARNAADVLSLVEKRTGSVHSAHIEKTVVFGTVLSEKVAADVDWAHGVRQSGTLDATSGSLARFATLLDNGEPLRIRALPTAMYMNVGAGASMFGGKHWIEYPYSSVDSLSGASDGTFQVTQGISPAQAVVAALASKDVRAVGKESVRGVPTTHYRGTVQVSQAAKELTRLTEKQAQSLRLSLSKVDATSETIDMWVSAANLPVKVVSVTDTRNGTLTSTAYYSDFGKAVTVQAPPAADTLDATALLKQAQKQAAAQKKSAATG
ncbi:LolA-like protein [Actinacidiphila yeochonensis]|uniref:hypothetical protein n=1 Tax=Actinacidiphila yeochonensis TaxID=89050 RepID=UPI00056B2568|nr:hypothetical protein [Actinacidiphila yeochonensis]